MPIDKRYDCNSAVENAVKTGQNAMNVTRSHTDILNDMQKDDVIIQFV